MVTFTYAYNKVLKFDEPADQDYPNLVKVGQKWNSIRGYIAQGFFIDAADVANSPIQKISGNLAAGDIKYQDIPNKNGVADGQIDASDKVVLGHPTIPEIVYGFGPTIVYKNWDLGIFFQGVANTSLMMSGFEPFGTNNPRNVLQWIADSHWSPNNQNIYAAYPRLTKDNHGNNIESSSFWLRDASFLKLKNLELGYTYKKARVFFSANNLLTFSNFKLWDPEQGNGNGLKYPTQRVFNIGCKLTIN